MRMIRFCIQNYKKTDNSGWISCEPVTAFVGKNEAGKSSIFRALSKLNPSDGEKYDGLKEFPRRRYAAEFKTQDWPVASVIFELSDPDREELGRVAPTLKRTRSVACTRFYSGKLSVEFDPSPKLPDTTGKELRHQLALWRKLVEAASAPEGKGEALGQVKTKILAAITTTEEAFKGAMEQKLVSLETVNQLSGPISSAVNEAWQREGLKEVFAGIDAFRQDCELVANMAPARKWVGDHLPKFVYFDRYDVIDSAIHIPTFLNQLSQTPSAPRVRATRALFEHVGLDLAALQKLDPTQPQKSVEEIRKMADERAILMSSASNEMTKRFSDWWEQRQHKFKYGIDGPMFRVWVSDDLDPSEIELDQRSAGMQYFFSFYLVFLVEARAAHANSILLLDEAGLQLHGTAQAKIVKFLEKLSKENQLLYSTHSPFMVDGDHLERVRVVYEDPKSGTTKVSEDVWPKDKDSLFPLQAALGYALSQSLFFSPRQLVVEGITDYWLLKAMSRLLGRKGKKGLREDVVVTPAGGTTHMMPLASLLAAHNIEFTTLLDGDEPGKNKGRELREKLLVKSFFVSDYCEPGGLEIEDLFSDDLYERALADAYPGLGVRLATPGPKLKSVADRARAAFEARGHVDFEKWRVARVLADWIDGRPELLSEDMIQRFGRLCGDLNSSWGVPE